MKQTLLILWCFVNDTVIPASQKYTTLTAMKTVIKKVKYPKADTIITVYKNTITIIKSIEVCVSFFIFV